MGPFLDFSSKLAKIEQRLARMERSTTFEVANPFPDDPRDLAQDGAPIEEYGKIWNAGAGNLWVNKGNLGEWADHEGTTGSYAPIGPVIPIIKKWYSANQSIATGTETILDFDTVHGMSAYDTDHGLPSWEGFQNTSMEPEIAGVAAMAPCTGWWLISAGVNWGTSAAGRRLIRVFKNSGGVVDTAKEVAGASQLPHGVGNERMHMPPTPVFLDQFDEIAISVFQNSGGPLDVIGGTFGPDSDEPKSFFAMWYLGAAL
jgi:hypothetical protein